MIKIIKAEKNASNWGSHSFLQGQLPQSPKKISVHHWTLKSPLKRHLSVVQKGGKRVLLFYSSENNQFLFFLQSANYSPKSSSTKNRMATNAFISSLSLLGGKSDDQIDFKKTFMVELLGYRFKPMFLI